MRAVRKGGTCITKPNACVSEGSRLLPLLTFHRSHKPSINRISLYGDRVSCDTYAPHTLTVSVGFHDTCTSFLFQALFWHQIVCIVLFLTLDRRPSLPLITGDGYRASSDFICDEDGCPILDVIRHSTASYEGSTNFTGNSHQRRLQLAFAQP